MSASDWWAVTEREDVRGDVVISWHRTLSGAQRAAGRMRRGGRSPVATVPVTRRYERGDPIDTVRERAEWRARQASRLVDEVRS